MVTAPRVQIVKLRSERMAICQLPPNAAIPPALLCLPWFSITRTGDELSLILPEAAAPQGAHSDPGWRCLEMQGPFPLDMVGVLAAISATLAAAGISIFAMSTFQTDYLLVRDAALAAATAALRAAGYSVTDDAVT